MLNLLIKNRSFFTQNKTQVAILLFLIWILAIWHDRTLDSFLSPLTAIALMTGLDLGLTWRRTRKLYWPSASIVTGFLIGLIVSPTVPWWIIVVCVFAAFISKQFIGAGPRQHIFNPAAFGIMTPTLLFGGTIPWWSVSYSQWLLFILIPVMALILFRMKRLWLFGSFTITYLIYFMLVLISDSGNSNFIVGSIRAILDGTFMLFALVMLPEPITSPARGQSKYVFGAFVALVSIALTKLNVREVFLLALLIANLVAFFFRGSATSDSQ